MNNSFLDALLFALAVSPFLSAQTAGLPPGEVLHYSPFATSLGSDGGAIQRLDPLTGQVIVLQNLEESQFLPGSMCVDAWRDRILFFGKPSPGPGFMRLHSLHAGGGLADLGFEGDRLHLLTPGSGGMVYLRDQVPGGGSPPLRYLDLHDVRHDVLDASGTQPYDQLGLADMTAMGYDPDLHALLIAIPSQDLWGTVLCAGGNAAYLTLLRLDLSADGARVLGSTCTQVVVDPLGANVPVSLSRMDDGAWLLAVDTNSNDSQARLQRIDPLTLSVAPFAFNGPYVGAAVTDAACWSSLRGEALLADNANVKLWSFAAGAAGTLVATSKPLVFGGTYGFRQTLLEVPQPGCAGSVGFYCTAKTTSSGCLPALSTSGGPSASAGAGFVVGATQVLPGMFGLLFYGTSGAAALPFQGGFLCVQPPLTRTAVQIASGAGPCGGTYAFDFNAYVASGFDPALVAGAIVHGQYWFRDPAEPIHGSGLTGGVRFTLCP